MSTTRQMAFAIMEPGDILLYRPAPGIGTLISWGEWTGQPQEAMQYSHAGVVINPIKDLGYEQNPPSTHYVKLSGEPWDRIDIWRINYNIPIDPVKLAAYAANNLGVPYPYAKIGQFLGADILARLGAAGAAKWVNGLWANTDPHDSVCSATVCEALDAAVSPTVHLWPKAPSDMRPADIPLGLVRKMA